jgi:PEP-CTERM motif
VATTIANLTSGTHLVTLNLGTGALTDLGVSVNDLDAIAIQDQQQAVPEPATLTLLATALAGARFARRRRR